MRAWARVSDFYSPRTAHLPPVVQGGLFRNYPVLVLHICRVLCLVVGPARPSIMPLTRKMALRCAAEPRAHAEAASLALQHSSSAQASSFDGLSFRALRCTWSQVAWNEISIGGEFETVDEKER